jgi:ABC-type amino acid transport substrate-binding protein
MSGNGTWSGMVALVSSGIADIGVGTSYVTKEKSEVVVFTDTLGFMR